MRPIWTLGRPSKVAFKMALCIEAVRCAYDQCIAHREIFTVLNNTALRTWVLCCAQGQTPPNFSKTPQILFSTSNTSNLTLIAPSIFIFMLVFVFHVG